MDKLERQIVNAEEAQQLLNNTMLQTAFAETRQAILETWAALPTSDTENARDLHRRLKMLDSVKRCLQEHVTTGKLANREIEGRQKLFNFRR